MDNRKIIKWSGSKTYLSHYVDVFIEDSFARGTLKKNFNYYEPFFGSGAVFFHIKKKYQIKSAYLNDNLHELIYFYKYLRDHYVTPFYNVLKSEADYYNSIKSYDKKNKLFLEWRQEYNDLISKDNLQNLKSNNQKQIAKLFILLNQSCFNGVYRKNPRGEFNVPHGRTYKKGVEKYNYISLPSKDSFKGVSDALKTSSLTSRDYKLSLGNAKKGDLVYLDPPYYDTVNYYGSDTFTKENQKELKDVMDGLIEKGVNVIMSNSDSKESRKLFSTQHTNTQNIPITRTIQRKKSKTQKYKSDKTELFITSTVPLKVVELFAGVGGFRLGLESKLDTKYKTIWSNQWEPLTKTQHASMVYKERFKTSEKEHSDEDIFSVETKDIPNHDLLVGGFPCQDYSVATTLKNSKGLIGKKGVLWWAIHRILDEKGNKKPKYLFLENVDRLLKSPSSQRGRDFAVMLKSLDELGYAVEWRVINAADYGMPQKRHRIYFLGYHKSTKIYKELKKTDKSTWLLKLGILAKAFKVKLVEPEKTFELTDSLDEISRRFNKNGKLSPFLNSGLMINGSVTTLKTKAVFKGKHVLLKNILQTKDIDSSFYLSSNELKAWKYLKGAKKIERTDSKGFVYTYSEGAMSFPDSLDKPSRTIITGEGGPAPSRFKHVIKQGNKYRRLTPMELERLNMFPDNHTKLDGITDAKRAFFMGNALVVGVIKKIGVELFKQIK